MIFRDLIVRAGTILIAFIACPSQPRYPTDTAETAAFKVAHSGASIVVIEDGAKLLHDKNSGNCREGSVDCCGFEMV